MKIKKWSFLILLCFGLSACERPDIVADSFPEISSSVSSNTWLDAPLPNANIPLLPYKLVFHGASIAGINEFEIQINNVIIATVLPTSSTSGGSGQETLFQGKYLWTPPAPGTYLIMVRAGIQGQFSSSDQVLVTVSGEDIEMTSPQQSTPTPTPTPTPSPTPTATLEELLECTYTALVNLFCRLGPGIDYKEVDSFVPGQSANIVGQSLDGFFWYVLGPNNGKECTVPKDSQFGDTSGDCDDRPRFTPIPPTITPTPTPTEEPEGCTVFQPDGSIKCVVPCPADADPGDTCTP